MSLVPKIKICILNSCKEIDVFEQTGIYNPNNLTGWGTPNIDTDDISEADVSIYDKTGNDLLKKIILKDSTIDVYNSVVGSPTPGPFLAKKDVEIDFLDGVYQINYNIYTGKDCVTYNFSTERIAEGVIPKLNYKDCNGEVQTYTFDSLPYEFSFCGIDEQTSNDIYYYEVKDDPEETVLYTEQENEEAFTAQVINTGESCSEPTVYKSHCYFLNTCALENCIKSLKIKAVENCDSKTISKIKNKIDQLELILYGVKSAFSCKDFDTVDKLLENAKIICDNLCDCGCGDC